MSLMRTIVSEFFGMFVDDWRFALALAVLIVVVTAAVLLGLPALPAAALLLAGCIGLLAWSVIRAARRDGR